MSIMTIPAPAATWRRGAQSYRAVAAAVVLAYLAIHIMRPVPAFPLDDPYITLHSAQVLHQGFDPNYPGVPALYGATSAPFLGLVYLLLFIASPLMALDAACWLGVMFYTLGLVGMVRSFRFGRAQSVLLIVLGLTASFIPFHLLNGLETSWALGCITWTLVLASMDPRYWWWSAALAGFTASVRPDMLPFCALIVAALVAKTYSTTGSVTRTAMRAALFSGIALLVLLPWAWWYYYATGIPYPQTGLAKRYFFAQDTLPWLAKVGLEGLQFTVFTLTCGPLVLTARNMAREHLGRALLLFCAFFFAAIYFQFPTALGWNWFRYPILLVPIMLWSLCSWERPLRSQHSKKAGLLLKACLGYSFLVLPICLWTYLHECKRYDQGLREVAIWCERSLPPGSTLLVHDAGYIAYTTPFRTVDFIGLKTPESIAVNKRYVWQTAGTMRAEAVSQIAGDHRDLYLVLLQSWPMMASLPEQLRGIGWRVDPVKSDGVYRVFQISKPQGLTRTPPAEK